MRRLRGPRRDSELRKRNSSLAAAFESRATVSRNIGIVYIYRCVSVNRSIVRSSGDRSAVAWGSRRI